MLLRSHPRPLWGLRTLWAHYGTASRKALNTLENFQDFSVASDGFRPSCLRHRHHQHQAQQRAWLSSSSFANSLDPQALGDIVDGVLDRKFLTVQQIDAGDGAVHILLQASTGAYPHDMVENLRTKILEVHGQDADVSIKVRVMWLPVSLEFILYVHRIDMG